MKRKQYSVEQIVATLKQAELGMPSRIWCVRAKRHTCDLSG